MQDTDLGQDTDLLFSLFAIDCDELSSPDPAEPEPLAREESQEAFHEEEESQTKSCLSLSLDSSLHPHR